MRRSLSLEKAGDSSRDSYYLFGCLDPSGGSKYLRIWRLRVEESKTVGANPLRIVNEVILPFPDNTIPEFDLYPCAVKNETNAPALALLPSTDPIVFETQINKAIVAWKIEGDRLREISPSQIEWCEL